MFTQNETQALITLLDRVSLSGKEAETLVYLKNKIRELTEKPKEPESKPEEDGKRGTTSKN